MADETKESAERAPVSQAPQPEKKADVPAKKEAVKQEKPATCATCNKSIKKKRHYYRNGKYFCTKRCWKAALKKEEKKQESEKQPEPK
jgi:formylmethanofuran dehydrogenase subunit E